MFKGDKRLIGLMLSGQQVPFADANIFITQPTIKQIVSFGEDDFLIAINLLSNSENLIKQVKQGNFELETYPDFQLLMTVLREDMQVRLLTTKLFELIFPDYLVEIADMSINFAVQDEEENKIHLVGQIHPYNFRSFQDIISDLFLPIKTKEDELLDYNPANELAAKIADKLKKGRERVQELKHPSGQSLFGEFVSTLSIGMNISMKELFEYTPFQLYNSYKRFFDKQEYDLYMRVSTMPFMDVSKMTAPEQWTHDLY